MGLPALIIAGIGLGIAGTGVSLYSAYQQNQANKEIIGAEEQANKIRQEQMEADARRQQLEVIRNQQRARAAALAAATNQGAAQGSGLQGGYGQAGGQTASNLFGINQNLGFGEQIFAINNQITDYRMQAADAATIGYFGQGLSSLGNSLVNGASKFNSLTGGGYGSYNYSPYNYYSPQAYSNYAYGNGGIY